MHMSSDLKQTNLLFAGKESSLIGVGSKFMGGGWILRHGF